MKSPAKKQLDLILLALVGIYLSQISLNIWLRRKEVHNDDDGEFMIQPVIQQMIEDGYKFYAKEIVNATLSRHRRCH